MNFHVHIQQFVPHLSAHRVPGGTVEHSAASSGQPLSSGSSDYCKIS